MKQSRHIKAWLAWSMNRDFLYINCMAKQQVYNTIQLKKKKIDDSFIKFNDIHYKTRTSILIHYKLLDIYLF